MDPSELIETDSLVDLQVPIAEGDISTNVEAVGEPPEDGFDGESGDGMPPEAGARHSKPPPQDAAGADAHYEQVLLDPSWAQYRDQWKLAPQLSGIRSPRLRFLRKRREWCASASAWRDAN